MLGDDAVLTNDFLHGVHRDERFGCRMLWLITFLICLPVATLGRLTGWRWQPWSPGPNGYDSIIKEANLSAKHIVGSVYSKY